MINPYDSAFNVVSFAYYRK